MSVLRLLERQWCHSLRWRWRMRRESVGECMFGLEACGLRCLGNTRTSVGDVWDAMAKLKGIVCDFQAQRGRRGFSGHSEPRVLRRRSLAGQLFQPSARLAQNDPARALSSQSSPYAQTSRQPYSKSCSWGCIQTPLSQISGRHDSA